MQFVTNGPDIPDALLHAHEEGRVVFFCGAGISRPGGLPDFGDLVQKLFQLVGEPSDNVESNLISEKKFDQAIGHYERRIQGGRVASRRGLPFILKGNLTNRRALTTHLALLTLGKSRDAGIKLVTTNFDTLFEDAASHYGLQNLTIYHDPPTRLRWDGVVHLHGRMPAQPSVDDLDQLILSDGDFGQAYLTQGWAARFVAGLFRDYTLCFVGYSIEDPVLRYMTAAHALDGAKKMFAFASYETGKAELALQAWKDKHVIPILYDDAAFHRSLHRTLHLWASVYRDGVSGKERLVSHYVNRLPKESKPKNDFVGRVLWALSDTSGLPAKRFADSNPAPSLEWLLDAFSDERYRHTDLERFDIPAHKKVDGDLSFSMIRRPTS
jgi:SIR2-like domain